MGLDEQAKKRRTLVTQFKLSDDRLEDLEMIIGTQHSHRIFAYAHVRMRSYQP